VIGLTIQLMKTPKYNEAMQSRDKKEWIKAVKEEHERMVKSEVWTAVDKNALKATD
jgi:hypothetical protein